MRFVALGLLAVVAASSDEQNLASLKQAFNIAKECQNERLDKAFIDKLLADMASFYAPVMEYCGVNPGSPSGFEMKGVPFASCGKGFAHVYASVKMISWSAEFGVESGSNGQVILVWQKTKYQVLSTNEMVTTIMAQKYKFNDQGLIVSVHQEFDPSKINPNLASLQKSFKITEVMKNKRLDKALIDKLLADLATFYAPMMEYCGSNPASSAGFEMYDVPFASCGKSLAQVFSRLEIISWPAEFGVESGSNGRVILNWQKTQYQILSTKEVVNTIIAEKYKFNDQGLIVSIHQEFDPSKIVEDAKNKHNTLPLGKLYNDVDDEAVPDNSVLIGSSIILTAFFSIAVVSVVSAGCYYAKNRLQQPSETVNMGLD